MERRIGFVRQELRRQQQLQKLIGSEVNANNQDRQKKHEIRVNTNDIIAKVTRLDFVDHSSISRHNFRSFSAFPGCESVVSDGVQNSVRSVARARSAAPTVDHLYAQRSRYAL